FDFESAKKRDYARLAIYLLKDRLKVNTGGFHVVIGLASIGIATKVPADIDAPSGMALLQVGNTLNNSLPNLECGAQRRLDHFNWSLPSLMRRYTICSAHTP
ncbi:hypothetical protein WG66_003072, partial [Moniliophthora roreri]